MRRAGARSRERHGGFTRLLENSRHSGSDPEAVISVFGRFVVFRA